MNRNAYLKFHRELCSEALDLSMRKNHDYSGGKDGSDPFLNFKAVEHLGMGVTTEQGFLVRLADKIRRLSGFCNTGTFKVTDESFRDTVLDSINYLCLLAAYCHSKSGGANCEGGPSYGIECDDPDCGDPPSCDRETCQRTGGVVS